jgi:hypothetical protein
MRVLTIHVMILLVINENCLDSKKKEQGDTCSNASARVCLTQQSLQSCIQHS